MHFLAVADDAYARWNNQDPAGTTGNSIQFCDDVLAAVILLMLVIFVVGLVRSRRKDRP